MSLSTIAYINAITSIIIFLSCIYVYLSWAGKNGRLAKSFLLIAMINLTRIAFVFYDIGALESTLLTTVSGFFIILLVSYVIYLIHPKCKPIFYVYAMYFYAVPSVLSGNILASLVIIRMIGLVCLLPFFLVLLILRTGELRLIGFLGTIGVTVFISMLPFSLLTDQQNLPLFIPYIFFTAAFIIFAHFSAHKPGEFMEKIEYRKRKSRGGRK